MEAAVAFQTACGAIELVQLCCRLVQTIQEIYTSSAGLIKDNGWIKEQITNLDEASLPLSRNWELLQSSQLQVTDDQKRLLSVCYDCIEILAELKHLLEPLRPDGTIGKGYLLPKARENSRSKQVAKLQERLFTCQMQLGTEILVALRYVNTNV